ncbi:MAG: inositol monophosphatase [Bacilli bacterium]
MSTISTYMEVATQCARDAGRLIMERLSGSIEVSFKTSSSDLVTQVDKEVEQFVVSRLLSYFPDHGILGEEGMFAGNHEDYDTVWIIDPIDGTTNFVHQGINFCVSISLYDKEDGLVGVIYDPTRDEMFVGSKGNGATMNEIQLKLDGSIELEESVIGTNILWDQKLLKWGLESSVREIIQHCRGIRSIGSAALELAYVAAGRTSGYCALGLAAWDYGAGKIIIEEAGGKVTRIDGDMINPREKGTLLACHPSIHNKLIELIKVDF